MVSAPSGSLRRGSIPMLLMSARPLMSLVSGLVTVLSISSSGDFRLGSSPFWGRRPYGVPTYRLRGGVMVTHDSSSVKLQVRFLAPAPIILFLMIFLCGSAGAVGIQEDTLYSFYDFDYYAGNSSIINDSNRNFVSAGNSILLSGTPHLYVLPASGSASGQISINSQSPLSYFSPFSPYFRFGYLSISIPKSGALVGTTYQPTIGIYTARPNLTVADAASFGLAYNSSHYYINNFSGTYLSVYASNITESSDSVLYELYFTVDDNVYIAGFGISCPRPSGFPNNWTLDLTTVKFKLSNTKYLPVGGSGGSGGSVDLSPLISDIASLSAQMTAGFNQVNVNIDSAESSIAQSIDDQTTALQGSIADAADDVNDHFDSWDSTLSGAFSSSDAQAVVDANSAVSEMHQIEQDQIDGTQAALDDVDLSSYELPSDYSSSLSEIGNLLSLIFDSLGFITPLIIFSCSVGLASVLVGRKSRGDS